MLSHPPTEEINLATVLAVLGDPTRLAILGDLARQEGKALTCSHFLGLTSKSNLTYHVGKMREAGIVRVEPRGTSRLISLRRADLDKRFPGLLDSIIATAITLPPPGKGAVGELSGA
ncbi:helix-turn-helix transcriptional regulator [Chelativorans sp. M5D2P16]|uniref:ArsR/SmtB family transcription factor n=1 Tax=Chelativorans sp. M5D2P16 TaxID=3095678 RepID=UPI002ACAF8F4|nr:helix-turn-helix transcriptional regulator [Chelativorans sp. M5D2P16]MDZ5698063.1 helix-turn-helix transcriptional regulator [Chelativorans sp. M5D2P16]